MGFTTADGYVKRCVRYLLLGEESRAAKHSWLLAAFILAQLLDYIDEIRSGVCPFCKKRPQNLFNHLTRDDFCRTVFNSLVMRGVELHRKYGLINRRNIRAGVARVIFDHGCYIDLRRSESVEELAKKIREAMRRCLGQQ